MSGTDLIVALWLVINTTTLVGTLVEARSDWRVLVRVERGAPTEPDARPKLVLAQREFIQDVLVAAIALLFDLAGVAALDMVHGPHPGSPLVVTGYVAAFLAAALLLSLKQAQRHWSRLRVRRMYDAHPWDQ